ncbi:MAG: hypothetical protein LKE61_03885 [Erysipelotrichaceae bacterium]|jgi:hypothetical protein|nr:hypothetical protein [Erysipelotrichaceae bacterium]MCH4045009.1 hypothetical protein [Erysipelotrichaceae bacterium]MCH4122221.1 hypothetical protein [Erysipelotrichaceae bacterium]MCI1362419.1 hypothetical protein [Solobacterium sp.]
MLNNDVNQFTAPANFKQGRLIMSRFRKVDLAAVIICSAFSLIAIMVYVSTSKSINVGLIIAMLIPAALAYVLTLPCGIYHNQWLWIRSLFSFGMHNNTYQWEGIYRTDDKEKNDEA